ncbi:hypothetical protein [Serratia fonticola]|uniref:hypothetical protein n=1 Tax=Serratia fonticola TaxID=47917 RepID=UPI003AAB2188
MTVSTEVSREEYTGNGVTTDFDYRFRVFKAEDLVVSVADTTENITVLTLNTNYTVTGAGSRTGGKVKLFSPLALSWRINIERALPVTQETDIRNQGNFFPEVHEDAFDKLTMLLQQVWSYFGLALRKPTWLAKFYDALGNRIANLGNPISPQDAVTKSYSDAQAKFLFDRTLRVPESSVSMLPSIANRKNKVLTFNNDGEPNPIPATDGSAEEVFIELAKPSGTGLVGTNAGVNLQTYLDGLYYDAVAFSEADLPALFVAHNFIVLRVNSISGPITIPPYKKLAILPLLGQTPVTVTGAGKKILVSRGSELYAPYLTCLAYNMDVVTVVGSSRPSFILAVSEPPKIRVNIQSEYRLGRALVMDATTDPVTNTRGVIAGVDIEAVVRGMDTAYQELMSRNGLEDGPTYINNNYVRLTVWQCRRGLIQPTYNHGVDAGMEVTANNYHLDYQSDSNSVDVVHIYGARNTVTGNAWDFLYPNLHSQSILVKGVGNTVGGRNFPALDSGYVSVDNPILSRNSYTGAPGGIDRQDIAPTLMLWKPRHMTHPDDLTITMPANVFMFKVERVVNAGTLVDIATKRIYFRSSDRLPLSLQGDVFVRNHSATTAAVRIGFGLSNVPGSHALSETFTIPAEGLIRVPLYALFTSNRLYATSGATVWYGYPVLTDVINFNLCISTDVPVTIAGCYLQLSKYDY